MDGSFTRKVAEQLPLGEAVLRIFNHIAQPDFLDEVFDAYRARSYESEITFPLFVNLIADALLEHHGSGRQSFTRSIEGGELNTTIQSAYGKLRRVPLSLSIGLLSKSSSRLHDLFPQSIAANEIPQSLLALEVFFHDGKTIKHVAKRLKVLEKLKGKVIGGRLVVTQSFSTGMVVAMGANEDGESGEQPLVPDVLAQTRAAFPDSRRLHITDRQYCDLVQMERFAAKGDHFLLRWNRKLKFHRDEEWQPLTGVDRYGRSYTEDWGWVGSGKNQRYVRRIHLHRESGKEDVILLTNLLEPEKYLADDLLEAYLHRWGIEQMFQKVTEVFHLQTLIGSSPRATVFQASFCFLLYNITQLIRAYIAEGEDRDANEISLELLFYDVHRQLTAWSEVLKPKQTVELLSTTWTPAQVARRLQQLLHGQWTNRWIKSPSNTHKNIPKQRDEYPSGGHTSVFRVMQEAQTRLR
tara:strand:+ start:477 stop:1874 length:1398 start_codon:yes stop_codon:yes gene_type:complete